MGNRTRVYSLREIRRRAECAGPEMRRLAAGKQRLRRRPWSAAKRDALIEVGLRRLKPLKKRPDGAYVLTWLKHPPADVD